MWYFYLINVIENLSCVFTLILVVGVLGLIGTAAYYVIFDELTHIKDFIKILKFYMPFYLICVIITILLPNKNTMYLMAGAKATEMLATTPEASKAREALNLGLDKILTELKEKQ